MKFAFIFPLLLISVIGETQAQSAYVTLGRQSLIQGDFKSAVTQLEKACVVDSTNSNALWMLGYSYFHSENYKKSIATYNRLIELKPADCSAYYYRALAKGALARDVQTPEKEKEKFFLGAIVDLTKASTIEPGDMKYYQNRGLLYRDYGIFKLQKTSRFYDKTRGVDALKASVADLDKLLADNPSRKDISSLLDQSRILLASVK
jgi:tetratricopeptide (TPR) repeat protein